MLSLLSFRRPALFIKAVDGYLSQYCRIHPQKLPSLLSFHPLPNLFLLPSDVYYPPAPPPNPSIPLVLNPSPPSSPQSNPQIPPGFFPSVCMCDFSTVKIDETRKIQIHHSHNLP